MENFLSLREFLLLEEPLSDIVKRSAFGMIEYPQFFVELYDKAKRSWEKYGDVGPPIGSKVRMLKSPGRIKRFDGVYKYDDRFFQLSYKIRNWWGDDVVKTSISYRDQWWLEFEVVEEVIEHIGNI